VAKSNFIIASFASLKNSDLFFLSLSVLLLFFVCETKNKNNKQHKQLSLGEWFMKYALKDSKGTGAGYEDDLKNNQYKPKGNLTASVGGSFKGANDV
jgi:hypothetical protein